MKVFLFLRVVEKVPERSQIEDDAGSVTEREVVEMCTKINILIKGFDDIVDRVIADIALCGDAVFLYCLR